MHRVLATESFLADKSKLRSSAALEESRSSTESKDDACYTLVSGCTLLPSGYIGIV